MINLKTFALSILIIILIFLTGCMSGKFSKRPYVGYSNTGLKFNQLTKRYKNTPIYKNENIKRIIAKSEPIRKFVKLNSAFRNESITPADFVDTQVFVSKDGNLESIIILKSQGGRLDSMVVEAIRQFKFKSLKSMAGTTGYSVFVKYYFPGNDDWLLGDAAIYPIINGQSTDPDAGEKYGFKVHHINEVDEPPVLVYKAEPIISMDKYQYNIRAYALLELIIDESGDVIDVALWSDYNSFTQPSIDAAWKCKFKPAKIKGRPVKVRKFMTFKIVN